MLHKKIEFRDVGSREIPFAEMGMLVCLLGARAAELYGLRKRSIEMKVGGDVERSVQWRVNNETPFFLSVPLQILALEFFQRFPLFSFLF